MCSTALFASMRKHLLAEGFAQTSSAMVLESCPAKVHEMARVLVRRSGPVVPPALSYLVLYSLVHELWHTEDLVHTRNVHGALGTYADRLNP